MYLDNISSCDWILFHYGQILRWFPQDILNTVTESITPPKRGCDAKCLRAGTTCNLTTASCVPAAPDSPETQRVCSQEPLPHTLHRQNAAHAKKSCSVFCFHLFVHCVVPGFIYFKSLKHYTGGRICNFLFFSIGLIPLVSNGLTNNKKSLIFTAEKQSVCVEPGPHKINHTLCRKSHQAGLKTALGSDFAFAIVKCHVYQ